MNADLKVVVDTGGTKLGPYNPCICVGPNIWVSGQIGVDGGDTLEAQSLSLMKKIDGILEAAGSSKGDLVFCTVLLADMGSFKEFNDIYANWLEGTTFPARAAYAVKDLPAGALVEVAVQAMKGSGGGN
jgi:2-iminobutanoate/2-iminopropanoate deaminase